MSSSAVDSAHAELGDLCAQTARTVGARVLAWRRERGQLAPSAVGTKSSPTDVVTIADTMAEELIRDALMAARPGSAWWGEETGRDAGAGAADTVEWVVDPIDGTTNFLYGLPGWSVSIAARLAGKSVAAAVAVPTTGETFHAVLGGGAWVDDAHGRRGLRPTTASDLSTALVATGFAYDRELRCVQGDRAGRLVGQVRDIRRAGAASVDLCSVAAGRVDAYFERGLQPWDLAAGALIAEEAGAVVRELASGTVVATGPTLATPLLDLLTQLGA